MQLQDFCSQMEEQLVAFNFLAKLKPDWIPGERKSSSRSFRLSEILKI